MNDINKSFMKAIYEVAEMVGVDKTAIENTKGEDI